MDASGPQRVQEDLEAVPHKSYRALIPSHKEAVASNAKWDLVGESKHNGKVIAGLSTRVFWFVIAIIAVVVVGASVGGAVGGTRSSNKTLVLVLSLLESSMPD